MHASFYLKHMYVHPFHVEYLWGVCCFHIKREFHECAGEVSGVTSFTTTDEQLNETEAIIFPMQVMYRL